MADNSDTVQLPVPAGPDGWQAPSHPEEMKAGFQLRWGDRVDVRAQARMTPAGLVAGGLGVSAILLAVGFIVRSKARAKG